MVWIGAPNCAHLDNYRRCRVHKMPWGLRWTGARPACILDRPMPPRDGKWTCPDQIAVPRPSGPPPSTRK